MSKCYWTAIAALAITFILAPASGFAQAQTEQEKAKAEAKAKRDEQTFEQNATVITFYDREGKPAGTLGERALYNDVLFSPDRKRVAVIKPDLTAENADLWIMDIATGKRVRITTSAKDEFVRVPMWSPDGTQIAYVTLRSGTEGLYRRAANGEGPEELLYKNPGAGLDLSDWSWDGRFLAFAKSDLSGAALYALPLAGQGERQPIEILRSKDRMAGLRFSPDGHFVSYLVVQPSRNEVWVRPFDPSGAARANGPWRVTENSRGRVYWKRDGNEMYYRGLDLSVMAAEVNTTGSTFSAKEPRVLFRPPGVVPVAIAGISNDGERFAALPPPKGPQLQQITVFDREGKVVNKVGKPGIFGAPAFSPDRTRLAVLAASLETGANNIWIYDIVTGQGKPLTNDPEAKGAALWSPDGRHIYWVSVRGSYSGIYRRASDGTGSEELVFRYTPGAGLSLTDISPEEKFLVADSGGVVLAIPLTGTDPLARKAIEYSRSEFSEFVGRLSPNGRFLAFRSDENDPDKLEIYVRPFDASTFQAGKEKWQLSKDGAAAMLHWRNDGKEFFYRAFVAPGSNDLGVMAVDVTTTPTFQAGTPKLLFKIPGPLNGNLQNISPDGQRFVFAINVPAQ